MVPRGTDSKIANNRIKAANAKRTARHYPWDNFKMFAEFPRFGTNELKNSIAKVLAQYDLNDHDKELI